MSTELSASQSTGKLPVKQRGRNALLLVTPPPDFTPSAPTDLPETFISGKVVEVQAIGAMRTLPGPAGGLWKFLHEVYIPSRFTLAARSIYELEAAVRHLESFAGRPVEVKDLTDEFVCKFLRYRLSSGISAATVNGNRAKLLALWRCAWRKRLVDESPRDVPRCREPREHPRAWTKVQIEQLARTCQRLKGNVAGLPARDYWTSLVLVAWDTSTRIGALRQVRTEDVDLGHCSLRIRASTQKHLAADQHWLADQTVVVIARFYDPTRELIWPWPHCRRWFFVQFRRIVEAAGLDAGKHHGLFHRVRRSSLSYTAAVGGIEMARRQAGHSTAAVTARHYLDPRIVRNRTARDVLPPLDLSNGDGQDGNRHRTDGDGNGG